MFESGVIERYSELARGGRIQIGMGRDRERLAVPSEARGMLAERALFQANSRPAARGFRRPENRDRTLAVARPWLWLMLSGLSTLGCGPDRRECTGPHPDFVVTLRLGDRSLPPDTVVHVTYGGSGTESYALDEHGATHEVVFCKPANLDGGLLALDAATTAEAGASGADDSVDELRCELWTGGFATLQVTASGLSGTTYNLAPREHECTVTQAIVLDSPDGG
jgi:hypothetical protein